MQDRILPKRVALAAMAVKLVSETKDGKPLAAKDINSTLSVGPRHLETALQALVHAKILKGLRGPIGGYTMTRRAADVSLADVYHAMVDADPDTSCGPHLAQESEIENYALKQWAKISIAALTITP